VVLREVTGRKCEPAPSNDLTMRIEAVIGAFNHTVDARTAIDISPTCVPPVACPPMNGDNHRKGTTHRPRGPVYTARPAITRQHPISLRRRPITRDPRYYRPGPSLNLTVPLATKFAASLGSITRELRCALGGGFLLFESVPTPNLKRKAHGSYAARGGNLVWLTLPQSR
jgi:hypothetical protein